MSDFHPRLRSGEDGQACGVQTGERGDLFGVQGLHRLERSHIKKEQGAWAPGRVRVRIRTVRSRFLARRGLSSAGHPQRSTPLRPLPRVRGFCDEGGTRGPCSSYQLALSRRATRSTVKVQGFGFGLVRALGSNCQGLAGVCGRAREGVSCGMCSIGVCVCVCACSNLQQLCRSIR